MLTSFGRNTIPARHFSKIILGKNLKIDLFSPHHQTTPSESLDQGPPFLYWLGISRWCPSLVWVPLPSGLSSFTPTPFLHCLVLLCVLGLCLSSTAWKMCGLLSLHCLPSFPHRLGIEFPTHLVHWTSIFAASLLAMPMALLAIISATLAQRVYYLFP